MFYLFAAIPHLRELVITVTLYTIGIIPIVRAYKKGMRILDERFQQDTTRWVAQILLSLVIILVVNLLLMLLLII